MAKIVEQTLIIKLSRLVRDDDTDNQLNVNESLLKNIEESVQQLVSDVIIVEAVDKSAFLE